MCRSPTVRKFIWNRLNNKSIIWVFFKQNLPNVSLNVFCCHISNNKKEHDNIIRNLGNYLVKKATAGASVINGIVLRLLHPSTTTTKQSLIRLSLLVSGRISIWVQFNPKNSQVGRKTCTSAGYFAGSLKVNLSADDLQPAGAKWCNTKVDIKVVLNDNNTIISHLILFFLLCFHP